MNIDANTLKVFLNRYQDIYKHVNCLYSILSDFDYDYDYELNHMTYYLNYTISIISLLDDYILRDILTYKFIKFKTFEEISLLVNYSNRQVYYLYNRAINKLVDILNSK